MVPDLRVSRVAGALLVTAVALAGVVAHPRAQAPPAAGVFVERSGGAVDRVASEMMTDVKPSSMAGAMIGRLRYRGVLPGAAAATTVSDTPVFLFQFDPNAGRMQTPPTDFESMAKMMAPAMPPGATTAEDFSLIRLTVESDERHCRLGSGRGGGPDAVAVAVEKTGPNAFRVRPKAALAAGQYLFAFTRNGPGGVVFPFTVAAGVPSTPAASDGPRDRES